MNKHRQKQLVKLAEKILAGLLEMQNTRLSLLREKLNNIELQSSRLLKGSKKFKTASNRRWQHAAERTLAMINRDSFDLSCNISSLREFINADKSSLPSLKDILTELEYLQEEFDDCIIDFRCKSILVITDYIELEGVSLGRFEIKLFIDKLEELPFDRPYRVIALEPNPAASDRNVTHPHVSHRKVCEGEAYASIGAAIRQARIVDFFNMVIAILENYNPDSPYVPLCDWEGMYCCEGCRTYCRICDANICYGCALECPSCGELVCNNCTSKCKECFRVYCKECLTDGFCKSCLNEREDNNEQAISAVQPHCMG